MSILYSISAVKELPRTIKKHYIWQQVNILAIHVYWRSFRLVF